MSLLFFELERLVKEQSRAQQMIMFLPSQEHAVLEL